MKWKNRIGMGMGKRGGREENRKERRDDIKIGNRDMEKEKGEEKE